MVFNISSIFKRYGPPEEVKIGTQSNYSGEIAQLPFTVLLEYPSKKTIFQFAFEGKVNGDMILGCIDNSLNPDIVMWSNHPEFVAPIFSSNPDYFKPIKDVSDQTIDELFNGVVDKGRYCLKTPTNKWPSGLN
jgi:hypothetical protein